MARLGSFAAPVDLPEQLRPWRAAGLETLFLPEGLPEDLAVGLSPATSVQAAAATARPVQAQTRAPGPAAHWPEPWQTIAARLHTKPQIIITYASLTADVTGAADPARRKLFQSILAYLAWPQGTSLFWPCTDAPGSASDAPGLARNIFLNGVLTFGVAHIACFGPEAARLASALFEPADGQPDVLVHSLPAPEELIGLLPHELHRAVARLKDLRLG